MAASSVRPSVTICGLGPGAQKAITEATLEVLAGPGQKFLRTSRHPSADRVAGATSFDHLYESADSFTDVYGAIATQVRTVAKAEGHAVYCVPGSPLVLERSVQTLVADPELDVTLMPAVSFLDEVWARLQVDPVDEGVRMVDGHRFATAAAGQRGPLLVAHTHAQWVLSDIKLALDPDPDQKVIVLQRLGTPDENVFEVPVVDLDRVVEPDHLTSLYFPTLDAPVARQLLGSVELMSRLRSECPWDRKQDHASLRKYLIEEAYEVLDAIDDLVAAQDEGVDEGLAYENLESELGDLWFQVLFHAQLATEAGQFGIADVAQTLIDKMVSRHPHVFDSTNDAEVSDSELSARWEERKQSEMQRTSVFDGVGRSLPALSFAAKTMSKAESKFGPAKPGSMLEAVNSIPLGDPLTEGEVGRLLMTVVHLARQHGVDAELALRQQAQAVIDDLRLREASGIDSPSASWVIG